MTTGIGHVILEECKLMSMKYNLTVDEDGILNLPDELLKEAGWKEGDTLEWIPNDDGSFTLVKRNWNN